MSPKQVLLFGGDSNESLVSTASAQNMAMALTEPVLWYWHPQGQVFQVSKDEVLAHQEPFIKAFEPKNGASFKDLAQALKSLSQKNTVVVLALHGGAGENGQVQKLLEEHKIAYTASDAKSSQIAFDKVLTKNALGHLPIKMAEHLLLNTDESEFLINQIESFIAKHKAIVIKPICGGSSLNCYFLNTESKLESVVKALVADHENKYFCEQAIFGREFTIGVIEHEGDLKALVPTEAVVEKDRHFDYQGKYLGAGTKELTPADLPKELTKKTKELGVLVHKALNLFGYSRTDMILCNNEFYFLEVNTLPGLTKQSLVPQQLAYLEITMEKFLAGQCELALKRNK